MSQIFTLIGAASSVTTSPKLDLTDDELGASITYQATVRGVGAVSASVVIEVSNDDIGWLADGTATISLGGTDVASAGFISTSKWAYVRARVTAISDNSSVSVTAGG